MRPIHLAAVALLAALAARAGAEILLPMLDDESLAVTVAA